MVSIPIARGDARKAFDGRARFVEAWGRGPSPAGFCKLLEGAAAGVHEARRNEQRNVWSGFPWLTLVLGSGCLELPDDPSLDPRVLSREIEQLIADVVGHEAQQRKRQFGVADIGIGVTEADHASDFAVALLRDRLQLPETFDDVDVHAALDEPITMSILAARFVLLASQMTRLYYEAMAREERPLSRWEADAAKLDKFRVASTRSDTEATDMEPVIQLCQWHCYQAREDIKGDRPEGLTGEMVPALERLLDDVQDGVGKPGSLLRETVVELKVLRQVTEVAWYLMTMGRGAYPGWTELLFGLLLQDHGGSRLSLLRREHQSDPIRELLGPATEQSWAARCSGTKSPRVDFYDAVAATLWGQSHVIRAAGAGAHHPPAATFVTGFDVEVEMAMWATGEPGDIFHVVVPVHVFSGSDDTVARPCWLRGEIRRTDNPHPSIDDLCHPTSWHVLSDGVGDGLTLHDLHDGPHVVHLSGGPLLTLPSSPDDDLWAELHHIGVLAPSSRNSTTPVVMEHAVTTDEYLAVRQAEAELLLTADRDKDQKSRRSRALPPHLTSSNPRGEPGKGQNPRFWFLVGVPIGDPAIRHRLISQLSPRRPDPMPIGDPDVEDEPELAGLGLGDGGADLTDEDEDLRVLGLAEDDGDEELSLTQGDGRAPHGIVVNRRITDDQAHLLYWMGFDVVRDSASSFIDDLHHYCSHLEAEGWRGWPPPQNGCQLAKKGDR